MTALFYILLVVWLGGVAFFGISGKPATDSLLWPFFVGAERYAKWSNERRLRRLLREAWKR